jgi:ABC-2 type transport system ATP-binding protein
MTRDLVAIGVDGVGSAETQAFRAGPGVTWLLDEGSGAAPALLECLAGVVRPAGATCVWNDRPVAGADLVGWQRRTTLVPDRPWEAGHLSVRQALRLAALLWNVTGARARDAIDRESARWGLDPLRRRRLANLSGGEMRRLLLAASLLPDPLVWLVAGGAKDLDAPGRAVWAAVLTRVHFGLGHAPRIAVVSGELDPALATVRLRV